MSLREKLATYRVPVVLLGLAAFGLALRLGQLGHRVFYYDEAWFGYWTLRFLENGAWSYRPILHGPFFARVNSVVFPLVGAADVTARLVVAGIGGLLPLAAWLFRDRLRDAELVALGAALALNPLLVYYSRFMRKDLPLVACILVTLGLVVRTLDTRRPRYLYAAGATMGVAFATKESVLLWLLTFLGAGLLILDDGLLSPRGRSATLGPVLGKRLAGWRSILWRWWPHAVLSTAVCLAVVTYFYAPRAGPGQPIGLWRALSGEFGTLPTVVWRATAGAADRAVAHWVLGSKQSHPYLPYFLDTVKTLAAGALGVCLLAGLGFLADRYAGEGRPLVAFAFYCGLLGLVGYPLANFLPVPWSTLHIVVPWTIPAAVGAGLVYRWGRSRFAFPVGDGWRLPGSPGLARAAVATLVLGSLVVSAGATVVATSYAQPHQSPADGGSEIVYYAQAPGDLRTVVDAIDRAAATGGDDVDVLYVGETLAMDESAVAHPPATGAWHARMPLPWYTEALDADVDSVVNPATIGDSPPPVVVAQPDTSAQVQTALPGSYEGELYALDDHGARRLVVYTRFGSAD
ncbi:flippase activity-associated protein Agl23 [Halobacteriales archaeon Cl-PHB]